MDRVVVIANPVASQFTGGAHRDVMAELAKTHDVEASWPGSATEATQAAREGIANGASTVVAMGGDGMVHHVAQAVVGTHAALGIVPAGTTNVVARLFDIPSRHTRAARLISRGGSVRTLGTARMVVRRGDIETTHHAVFACGFGLDARVVQVADADPYRKYRFGSLHYARSALGVGLREFPSVRPHVQFSSEGHEAAGTTALVQFREVYTYFGRIALRFGDERPDPMSALILDRLRRRRVPRIVFSALAHRDLDAIEGFQVWHQLEAIEVEADPPVAAQADGEGLGLVDGARVSWEPASLTLIAGA